MKHFNRAAAILVCLFIIAAPLTRCFYSYADSVPSGYTAISDNEKFTQCFLAYCRSRDTDIVGGGANAIATFTYSSIVNASSQLGIDLTRLQAELYYKQEGNQGIQWFMTATGVSAFNELFAQLITDAGLEVGDSNVDVNLYDGQLYGDSLTFVLNKSRPSTLNRKFENNDYSTLTSKGTYYEHDYKYLWNLGLSNYFNSNDGSISGLNVDFSMPDGTTKTINFSGGAKYGNHMNYNDHLEFTTNGQYVYYYNNYVPKGLCAIGIPCIIYFTQTQNYGFGLITYDYEDDKYDYTVWYLINSFNEQPTPATINFVTINNNFIKNEYQGDTIINNDGTPVGNDPTGGTPPNWDLGGGQGTAEDGNGNTWNITWPSFELPDLNIDWSIHGLSEKFPFSIPFDLVSLVTVLSAEPEAPQFTGTVDLKVYQWNYDLDFSQFNTVAAVFRTAETLLFVFGLIMITRKIIRG